MNKKIWIIIACIVAGAFIVWIWSTKQKDTSTQLSNQAASDLNLEVFDSALAFDNNTLEVKKYSSESNEYLPIAKLEKEPSYLELSPDSRNFLSSTFQSDSDESKLTDLTITNLADKRQTNTIANTFSPRWLDQDRIIYQDPTFEFIVYSITNKASSKTDIKADVYSNISIINDNEIIIVEDSSDAGESMAKLVNLKQKTIAGLVSGNGLSIKTLRASEIAGYQTIVNEKVTSILINYLTKKTLFSLNQPISNIAWSKDGSRIFYQENDLLISENPTTQQKDSLMNVRSPIQSIEIVDQNQLFIKTTDSTKILPL